MSNMDRLIEVIAKLNTLYNSIVKHDSGRILGSMTTKPHPLAIYSYLLFIHTNLADTVMYPELIDLKNELQKDLSKYYGEISELMVTTGGTESNFTAILSAWKNRGFREKIVIAPDTVHVSIDKTCDIIDCRLIKIPVGNKPVEPDIVEEYVRKYNPFAIVITAGTTERGLIDPVKAVAEIAEDSGTYLHVDAAYGGLIIPHLYKHGYVNQDLYMYDGVSSITIDFHKNGLTPIPSSVLLFREKEFYEKICYNAEYILTNKYCGLLGTRPGASLVSIWTMWKYTDWNGYEKLAMDLISKAYYLYDKLIEIPDLIVYKPILPIVVFKHRKLNYKELLLKLIEKKYYLYKSPSLEALRIVVMPHVEKKHIDEFIEVLKEVLNSI